MKHVTSEEKYEWDILKVVVMESSILVGRIYCVVLNGSFLGALCLYFL